MENGHCASPRGLPKFKRQRASAVRDFPPGCGRFVLQTPNRDTVVGRVCPEADNLVHSSNHLEDKQFDRNCSDFLGSGNQFTEEDPDYSLGTYNDVTGALHKVREPLRLFQGVCRKLLQEEEAKVNGQNNRSSVKRKLDFTTEALELETEVFDRDLGFREGLEYNTRNAEGDLNVDRKNMGNINKFRYVGPSTYNSCRTERTNQGVRALSVSISGQPGENAGKEPDLGKNHRNITPLDVLKMLAAKCDCDSSLENRSILDVAKSRGMTFP
ncbi:hypothetical protein Pint_36421 [Pistacia integerrima]|uniref:Uncharacterized protein n=1 Tax=Pistacia integerrima TaxID=434235 RepID=A0ACC0Y3M1_9ROSI|nr:hypothetical protein Pint_36421 [Pistacia integerrima]